ncbi:putative mrc1-like domain-containing protein [Phaeoacremonium minimum UCRPA7]|uniref:Putative mrc1-like domain-containing protein n=1 Tax=Phaeoacremonium minimum (strain UCR-PA7) TaxID=1286976 RepID=R8BFY2_PHAM7|nr:putative mrc1-like domain-containing protein [Phaeoacremonium minimum UCRPA7]EON98197.1 putative mrc1-like domain-containing protein [Phaeoacremonium minimum UCRPA7]
MASSRASSPASNASDSKFDLSPRSRLKALLATVGSDSEGDNPSPTKKTQAEKTTTIRTNSPDQTAAESSEGDDDDEEDIIRPRGRLAARMLGINKTVDETQSDKQDDPRERVKKMLQKAAEPAEKPQTTEEVDMADAEDDADELPVHRRKLKNRQHRSTTPRAATPARSPTPAPSLFVTPDKAGSPSQRSQADEQNDDDSDVPAIKSDRFKALVERKRAERKAREAEEERKKAARMAGQAELMQDESEDDVSDITDDEGGRKLTQEVKRPAARKASKKALEEMNRETQRMSRALQLAHEAKTKKKITKASLFERFNFKPEKPEGVTMKEPTTSSSRPATPTSSTHTDTEMKDADTPPSSPPARVEHVLGKTQTTAPSTGVQQMDTNAQLTSRPDIEGDDPPTIEEFLATSSSRKQEKSTTPTQITEPAKDKKPITTKRNIRVKLPAIKANLVTIESDEELVITETKKSKIDAIFDRIPEKKAKESNSIHALRRLAHIDSPEKKPNRKVTKSAMTAGELQAQLQQRARQQAKLERDRRLEMLKAKGIHIQTEEEREREMAQVEDIVARARHEAEEIMQREREAAKKAKKESGEADPLAWDDSDDSDFAGDAPEEPSEIELSGSEEEVDDIRAGNSGSEVEDQEEEDVVEDSTKKNPGAAIMFDEEAESNESESEDDWVDPDEEEERNRWGASEDEDDTHDIATKPKPRRSKKHVTILSDDEDNDVESTPKPKTQYPQSPAVPKTDSPQVPTSVLRSATKTFIPGLPVTMGGPAGLGLTQIFAGTMDDSQADSAGGSPMEFMPTFDSFPETQVSQVAENDMIYDSQPQGTQNESQGIHLDITQSQEHGFDSILNDLRGTQTSDMLEPSQDAGFQNYTPLKERFVEAPHSTIDTVVLNSTQPTQPHNEEHDSPLVQRKGRLRRKIAQAPESDDDVDDNNMAIEEDEFGFGTTNAFDTLKDAAIREKKRKARHDFDKKKSKAKEMVEDQAEESEDEYAGLGGADGEDSDNESAASVHEMIDDNTQANGLDDAKLAAFYADRERANDEKQVEKLFRDITSGMLRRKRGADYDLSDSDDGGEARRRMKRRQFAKMQKALFADERISKVAENPRNQAFMKTIEDLGSDDDMDFLFEPPAPPQSQDSQSQEPQTVPDSQPVAARQPLAPAKAVNRPPAAARRTKNGKKPSNIGEIRESLSNLLEEPSLNTVISATDLGSDSDDADDEDQNARGSNKENNAPQNPRRTNTAIVDRISLKRQGSSSVSTASAGGRMAFAAPSTTGGSFKVPALLRRATTNSLMSSSSSSSGGNGHAAGASGFGEEAKIKKSAGKRSGINYFARENERRAAMEESAKRREAKKFKGAEGRVKVVGGLFGAGKFE